MYSAWLMVVYVRGIIHALGHTYVYSSQERLKGTMDLHKHGESSSDCIANLSSYVETPSHDIKL